MTMRNDASRLRIPLKETRRQRAVVSRQGQVLLDTDFDSQARHQLERIEIETLDMFGMAGRLITPAASGGFKIVGPLPNFDIAAGRGYLDGWLLENTSPCKLATQPHPYDGSAIAANAIIAIKALVRHVDPAEDAALADVALGDAQASGRALNDWQVLRVNAAGAVTCATAMADAAWTAMAAPSTGTLAVLQQTVAPSSDPCSLTPSGGYSRLENLLYRIEVHGGTPKTTTADGPRYGLHGLKIKLSRRNASLMVRIDKIEGAAFTVSPPALDMRNWFAPGSYAEVVSVHDDIDPRQAAANERLFRVAVADDDKITLEATAAQLAAIGAPAGGGGTWFLRLWDAFPGSGGTTPAGLAEVSAPANAADSAVIDLGDGLSIQLSGGAAASFRRGDCWTCAVRADGSVAWPKTAGVADKMTPHGPETRYAVLAVVAPAAAGPVIEDCRITPAALTDRSLLYRGGDGQSVPPPTGGAIVALPARLRVAVFRGETPVANVPIRWELVGPAAAPGQINDANGAFLVTSTGPDGLSEIKWSLNGADLASIHQIRATIANAPGAVPMVFSARFETAAQQVGCSTYVIAQGSDWVATLASIKPGEDALVCFQRGTFLTDKPIILANHGHLTVHGAGEGSIIKCTDGETALRFERCNSVTVRDLRIETGNSRETSTTSDQHRNGTLTIVECPRVSVTDTTLRCGSHHLTERTCLTVQGSGKKGMQSAHIARNTLLTGYAQDGMLVTDCAQVVIEQNQIYATLRNSKVTAAKLKNSKQWQAHVRRQLVEEAKNAEIPPRSGKKRVRMGKRIVEFESAMSQEDWDALTKAFPTDAAAVPNAAAAKARLEELMEIAIASPDAMPGFKRAIERIGGRAGAPATAAAISKDISRAMLISSEITAVERRAKPSVETGKAVVAIGEIAVEFKTPISTGDWSRLQQNLPFERISTQKALKRELQVLAARLVADAKFRAEFPSVAAWYKINAEPGDYFGRQAITCGGQVLGDVAVERNVVRGFVQGVHIGTSKERAQTENLPVIVTNARIVANELYLQKPFEAYYAPYGIFLGNMESGRIERNLLAPGARQTKSRFAQGIRVWGHLGRYLMIIQNNIGIASLGIRVKAENEIDRDKVGSEYLWLASANLVQGVEPSHVIRAPSWMIVKNRDNRPEPA